LDEKKTVRSKKKFIAVPDSPDPGGGHRFAGDGLGVHGLVYELRGLIFL
jgi:hypothetical protein